MMEAHTFKPFRPAIGSDYNRADVEFYGIDHFRQSYTGLVFFNLGKADIAKLRPDDPRCAGEFSIFGHENCAGDPGHCTPRVPQRFDMRRSHPLTAAFKRVIVTDGLTAALADSDILEFTIVVSDEQGAKKKKKGDANAKNNLLVCKGLQIVTFA